MAYKIHDTQWKKEEFEDYCKGNYILQTSLISENINHGTIIPYNQDVHIGVYDKYGKYVQSSSENSTDNANTISNLECQYFDIEVIYIGNFGTNHYGNFLIDNLSRLWKKSYNGQKFAYVSKSIQIEEVQWCSHIMTLIGILPSELIRITSPTTFKKVIVPQKSMIHWKYIATPYIDIYARMYDNMRFRSYRSYDRIYFTRRQLEKHKEIGERIIEIFFQNNGFHIIAPEKIPIEEQAYLVRNCSIIASLEGTLAHNIVFSLPHDGHKKQIIIRKQSEIILRQIQINQILGIDTIWISCYKEFLKGFPISHDRGPFLLEWNDSITEFAQQNAYTIPYNSRVIMVCNRVLYLFKCVGYKIWHEYRGFFKSTLSHFSV